MPNGGNRRMKIRKATIEDIDRLIELRLDYLRTDCEKLSDEQEQTIRTQLQAYFAKHIPMGDFIAMLAETDNIVVSVAFLVISEKPANPSFITGITGTILNVLTYPEYRRKGIGSQVVAALIEEAKQLGVSSINLSSTEDGRPMYEKLGFILPTHTEMRLNLI
jgi:ribosomal protein S18 acetylase RimI-like enzyme